MALFFPSGCTLLNDPEPLRDSHRQAAAMFTADLSWTDYQVEKVGERRQRKKQNNPNHNAASRKTSSSSEATIRRPSTSNRNTSALNRIASITKSVTASVISEPRRPSTARPPSSGGTTAVSTLRRKPSNLSFRDPAEQPDYVLSAKFSPTLPSGESFEPPVKQANDNRPSHSRQSNRSFDTYRPWSIKDRNQADSVCQSYERVKDAVLQMQARATENTLSRSTSASTKVTSIDNSSSDAKEYPDAIYELGATETTSPIRSPIRHVPLRIPPPSRSAAATTAEARPISPSPKELSASPTKPIKPEGEGDEFPPQVPPKTPPPAPPPNRSHWKPPVDWDIKLPGNDSLDPSSDESPFNSPDHAFKRPRTDGTHFQRFVRRMETAGPRIILERLKEDWSEPEDEVTRDELGLEKHLWALTALQMRSLDRFAQPSQSSGHFSHSTLPLKRRRKILELDGNLGEVYQLSAIYPDSKINYFSSHQKDTIPLPSQIFFQGMPLTGIVPLPYTSASMHHIRASSLPSLLPSSQIPALLAECHRVLKPGGILELRIVDPIPERSSTGPRLRIWLEDHLVLSLERHFRCARPFVLVPGWVQNAGFKPLPSPEQERFGVTVGKGRVDFAKCLKLPAAVDPERDSMESQVGMHVGRELWKDVWGPFVDTRPEGEAWWWEDEHIVRECLGWRTVFEVGTLFAMKEA